jgi:Rrf2 family protein
MISKKCMYALIAVLALARNTGGKPMTIHQIADAESIPPRFLEAILRDLKQNGLTDSVRGKDGGYLLAQPPNKITMGRIIRLIEGPWFTAAEDEPTDVFTPMWERAESCLENVFDQKDFQTLVSEHEDLRRSATIDYSI